MLSNLMFLSQSIPPGEQPWAGSRNPFGILHARFSFGKSGDCASFVTALQNLAEVRAIRQAVSRRGLTRIAWRFNAGNVVDPIRVPKGRLNVLALLQPSLRDLSRRASEPSDKSPGYSRWSLRDVYLSICGPPADLSRLHFAVLQFPISRKNCCALVVAFLYGLVAPRMFVKGPVTAGAVCKWNPALVRVAQATRLCRPATRRTERAHAPSP